MIFSQIGSAVRKGTNYIQQGYLNFVKGFVGGGSGLVVDAVTGTIGNAVSRGGGIVDTVASVAISPAAAPIVKKFISPLRQKVFTDDDAKRVGGKVLGLQLGDVLRRQAEVDFGQQADRYSRVLDPEYEQGQAWEEYLNALGAGTFQIGTQAGIAVATGGTSLPAQLGILGATNAAMVGGSESVAEYNKQIQNGVPVPLAADRAALSFAQNAGLGFAEGMTDYLFLGLGKLGRGTRAVKALEPLRKITERLPKYARVGAAAGRGALTEGLQEGVQGVLQEEISRAADRDALGSPLAAADRLFNNEGTQRIFWENFAIGALLGGAFGGGIELATSSVPVTTEFLGKIGEEGSVNDEVLGELQELNEQERGDAVAVATYRAAAEKNADLPDAAVYAGLTRTGKRGIDDVIGKILKRDEFVTDADFGTIALPTKAEVAAQFVDMDLVGRTMEQAEGYRAARQEQERVADEQLRARPQEVLRVADGRVETSPGVDGRFSLADFNLERVRGQEITPEAVVAARRAGKEGVFTDTGESVIFDESRVRRVLGDRAVGEVQEQHRAQFREKIFEKVPSLREAEVEFVDGLIDGKGIGSYLNGTIKISKQGELPTTLAHEGAHHYFDTGLDTAGKNRVIEAIKSEYAADVQEQMEKHGIGENEAIQEVFSNRFAEWAAQDAAPKTFLERVWAKLRDILRDIVESPELRRVYRDFARGEGRLEMARADAVADGMGEQKVVERMREAFYDNGLQLPLYQRGEDVGTRLEEQIGYATKFTELMRKSGIKKEMVSRQTIEEIANNKGIKKFEREKVLNVLGDGDSININDFTTRYAEEMPSFSVRDIDDHRGYGLYAAAEDAPNLETKTHAVDMKNIPEGPSAGDEHIESLDGSDVLGWWRSAEIPKRRSEKTGIIREYKILELQSDWVKEYTRARDGQTEFGTEELLSLGNFLSGNYADILLKKAAIDARDKGYSQVLLPTADTAAKIQGFKRDSKGIHIDYAKSVMKQYDLKGVFYNTAKDLWGNPEKVTSDGSDWYAFRLQDEGPLYQRGDEGEGIILNVADYLHNRDFQKRFDVPLTDEEQKVVQSVRKRYVAAFERERGTGLAKNEEMKRYDQAASQAAQRLLGFTDGNVPRAVALAFRLDDLPGGFEENEIIGQKVIDMSGTLKWRNEPLYQRGDEMLPMQVVREGAKIENELGRTSIKYKNPMANIVEVQTNAALTTGDLLGEKHYSPSTREWDVFGWWVSSDAGGKYFISEVQSDFIVEAALRESDEEMGSDWGEDQDFIDASKKQWAETMLRRAAEDARAERHTKIYIANEETAGMLQFGKREDWTDIEHSIAQKYSRRGVIIRSAKRLFGDAVDAEIDGHGVFEFDIQGDEGGESAPLYQRGEDGSAELMGQVARRVEARDGVVPSADVVRKELLKGLLAYRAVQPEVIGGVSYYPVYINVGDGKFEKGMSRGTMMAGWFSIKDGAVTGVGVRKWAEGAGRGDVRFDSQDPVMYEKVGDVLMEHLDAEGMTVVEWQATGKVADKIGEYLRVQKGGPVLHTNKRWDEILEMIDAKKSNWKLPRRDDTLYQRDDSSWNDLLNALGAGSSKFELRKEVDKIRKREEKFGDMQTRFPSGTHAIGDVAESWTKAVNGIAEGAVSGYVVAVDRRSDGDQYWIVDEGVANKEQASEIAEKIDEIGDVSIAERIDLIRKIANDVAVEGAFDKWAVMTVRTPMEKPLYQRGVLEVQRDWAVMPLDEGDVGGEAPLYQRAKLGAKQAQWVKEAGLTEAKNLTQNEQAQVALTGQEVAAPSKSKGLGIAARGVVRRVPDVLRKFGDDLWGRYQRFAHLNETFRTTRLRDIQWASVSKETAEENKQRRKEGKKEKVSFVEGYNRMGKDGKLVQRAFDIAFMNNDVDKVLEMAGEYDFQDSVVALREDLEQLWHEIDGRGLDIGWLKGYLPRFIKQKNFTAEDAFVALETVRRTKAHGRSLRRHASNLRDRAVDKIDNENIDNYVSPIEAVEGYYSAIGGLLGTMEFFGHRSLQEYGDLALSDTGREYFDEWLFNKERPTIFSTPESIAEKKGELMEDWAGKIRAQKGKMGNKNQPRVGRAERAPVTDEDALREVFLKEMSAFLVEDRSPRGWLEEAYDNFKRYLGDDLEIDRENKIVNITKSVVNTRDRLLWEGKFKDTNELEEMMETLKGVFEPLPFSWRAWGSVISEARMFTYGILLGSPLRIPRDLISLIHIGLRPDSKGWRTLGRAMKQMVTPKKARGRPLLTPKELGLDSYMAEFYAHERGGGWFSRAGEKVFTFTGMRSVDDLRRVLSNEASMIEMGDYLRDKGDEAFIEKFDVRHLVPEEQVAGVVEAVRKGQVTTNVGILLFAQEGMIIPNSQYQAPVLHKHPVARATTMLLGEAIHETNFMFNKALKQVEDHGALGGSLRILVAILLPYLLAGVSTEYLVTAIRQWRLPQAHEMPIFVMDTMARLLFTSRWDIRSLTDGDFTAFAQGFIPALGAYSAPVDSVLRLGMGAASDDPEKVTRAIDKGLRKIPIVGDPWYSWFSDTAADDVKKYEEEVGRSAESAFRYWLGAPEKKKKVRGLTSGRSGGGLGGLDTGLGDLGDLDFLDLDIDGLSL